MVDQEMYIIINIDFYNIYVNSVTVTVTSVAKILQYSKQLLVIVVYYILSLKINCSDITRTSIKNYKMQSMLFVYATRKYEVVSLNCLFCLFNVCFTQKYV